MSKDDKKSIYDIYRACRLCGAGAGYKMPILQNVIDVDGEDIELKQKIKECVQIEVHQEDRMPPLICELCVDKVNDFYEFLNMCQRTNKWTRQRLGLPLQMASRNAPDNSDCIFGVTEKVYINSDSEGEPLSKHQKTTKSKPKPKSVKAKEAEAKIKVENQQSQSKEPSRPPSPECRRETRTKRSISPKASSPKRAPSPKRTTRNAQNRTDDFVLDQIQDDLNLLKLRPSPKLSRRERDRLRRERDRLRRQEKRKEIENERAKEKEKEIVNDVNDSAIPPRSKRLRDSVDATPPSAKKAKIKKEETKPVVPIPPVIHECTICHIIAKSASELGKHSKRCKPPAVPAAPEPVKAERPRPGPKSKTAPKMPQPKPKPENRRPEPPKIEDQHNVPSTRAKRPEPSPIPKKEESQKKEVRLSLPERVAVKKKEEAKVLLPPKIYRCDVCAAIMRNAQALSAHYTKLHHAVFTPKNRACNACETWFPTTGEAEQHHLNHRHENIPYTCNKCYDDFVNITLYESHFKNNQCLSTYEVPDVKCEECWRTFATYKLLEDHKCAGQTNRPGGNCSKCSKRYSLLRNQIPHEIKCRGRKNGEPIDPEVASKMLPMQVRLVRCDSLLKTESDETYDVSTISHTFGLDKNHTYPYFYSKGAYDFKTESLGSLDHMVSINDEIKEEFLQQNYVHWDSEDSEDSNTDSSLNNKDKSVQALSTLSLKTLFSPKCLGKVPRKKKINEKPFDSVLSINFSDDIQRNIDSIINDLGEESVDDSDSILGKNQQNNKNIDIDSLKTSEINNVTEDHEITSVSKNPDENTNKNVDQSDYNEESDSVNEAPNQEDNNKTNDIGDDSTQESEKGCSEDNEKAENTNVSQTDSTEDTSNNNEESDKDISNEANNHTVSSKETTHYSDNCATEVVNNIENKNEELREDDKVVNDTLNGDVITDEIVHNVHETPSEKTMQLDNKMEVDTQNAKESSNNVHNNIDLIDVGKETLDKDKEDIEINTKSSEMKKIDDTQSMDSKNDKSNESHNSIANSVDAVNVKNDAIDNVSNGDTVSLNSLKSNFTTNSDGIENNIHNSHKLNMNEFNDDTKDIMDELDAQIGENGSRDHSTVPDINLVDKNDSNDNERKKKSLSNAIQKRDDELKSLELDNISEDDFEL